MKILGNLLILPFIAIYCGVFLVQEKLFEDTRSEIPHVPSYHLLLAVTGYLHQLTAEFFFVKTAVFIGGLEPGADHASFAPSLANNYRQITKLYPEFIDPYYFVNAHLPYIGKEFAEITNDILATGIVAHPKDFLLHLFKGINYLQYLEDPLAAATTFQETSKIPNAPPMFGHLASILAAQGGDLQAALITLEILNKNEDNKAVRERYGREIELFRKAIELQKAVIRYHQATGAYPDRLTALVPVYIHEIPTFDDLFELVWDPPQVKLKRPTPKQSSPAP